VNPAVATGVLTFGIGALAAKALLGERLTAIRFNKQIIVNVVAAILMGFISPTIAQWHPDFIFFAGLGLAAFAAMRTGK
jgi:hypothetical protein